jgi:1-deoxy-D-xylulose-5-phosphate synthase
MRFAKPIDELLLHEVFGKFKHVITVEDGCLQGGMGSAVLEFMGDNGYAVNIKRLGIPDRYIEHGTQDELYVECGYDVQSMINTALGMLQKQVNSQTA